MSEELDKEFEKVISEILAKTIQSGKLIVCGANQTGKTNATQWLVRTIRNDPKHQSNEYKLMIFDTALNWVYKFDKCPYVEFKEGLILPIELDLILNLSLPDPISIRDALSQILLGDFNEKRRIKANCNGQNPITSFYILEEAQSIFGRFSLGQKSGRFIYKLFCECSNFGMVFILLTQRIADLDTRIAERTRYFLLGRMNGSNDLARLTRMFGSEVAKAVSSLKVGSLIFYDKEENSIIEIGFPLFVQKDKPYQLQTVAVNTKGYVRKIL
jgi:hypothetical protein